MSTPNLVNVTLGANVFKVSFAVLFNMSAFLAKPFFIGSPTKGKTPITLP
tara:strand:- start:147 stop:296 length:150 start_codon:yes stop_codon:yes gene_type:complete